VIDQGTAVAARIGRPAAGKTGTTQDYRDAWFVGYTPTLATAVWMGYPKQEQPMRNINGVARVTGGSFPARIWRDFMNDERVSSPDAPDWQRPPDQLNFTVLPPPPTAPPTTLVPPGFPGGPPSTFPRPSFPFPPSTRPRPG
jgi:penicillin-binding protein 1A